MAPVPTELLILLLGGVDRVLLAHLCQSSHSGEQKDDQIKGAAEHGNLLEMRCEPSTAHTNCKSCTLNQTWATACIFTYSCEARNTVAT